MFKWVKECRERLKVQHLVPVLSQNSNEKIVRKWIIDYELLKLGFPISQYKFLSFPGTILRITFSVPTEYTTVIQYFEIK